jgi:4a-hydroxytetrahydrobiopterin dehydratase
MSRHARSIPRSRTTPQFNGDTALDSLAPLVSATDHHPKWFNVWNTVCIDLATHDAGGITALDLKLAHSMEELAGHQAH